MSALKDRYINPLTDFGFKKLFGTEPNKDLLIDFLNQLLPERHHVKDLSYRKNDHKGYTPYDRSASFDIKCEGKTGEKFIVEMQKAKQQYFKDRSVYYSTFPVQEQGKQGKWDFKLTPVYTVAVLDFTFDDEREEPSIVQQVQLKNQDCEVFFDKLHYIFIELPRFTKKQEELETTFDKWLYVMRHLSELKDRPKALQERVFKKLFKAAEIANYTPEEKEIYEQSLKEYRDIQNSMETADREGEKRGRMKEKIAMARKLKAEGVAIEIIQRVTGLSREEIEKL